MKFARSSRLSNLSHESPGPIAEEAVRLEAAGHRVMRLDVGDPHPFGFEAPAELIRTLSETLADSAGYSAPKGLPSARHAVT